MLQLMAVVAATVVFCSTDALAATGSAPGQNPVVGGIFLGLGIAYLARRREIGGWLLYFYMQLFITFLVTGGLLPTTFARFKPGEWTSASMYVLYLVSTAPVLVVFATEVSVATYLLFRRTEGNVRLLQRVLMGLVVAATVALAIDLAYFNDGATIFFDVITLFFAVVWSAYFQRATRVRLVFIERKWDYAALRASKVPLSSSERQYLRKRAILCAAVTFVALLLMMGSAIGDKKPDAGIFFVPLFYAFVAATLGWYLPIRKRKRDALAASELQTEPA